MTLEDIKKLVMKASQPNRFIYAKELIAQSKLSYYILRRWVKKGLPFYGSPKQRRYILQEVKAWAIEQGLDLSKYGLD